MVIEGEGNELLSDYERRQGFCLDMRMCQRLESYGISRLSDILKYGEEVKTGTRRTSTRTVHSDEWGSLIGRQVQVWENKRERGGVIVQYTDAAFEVRYEDGELHELSVMDCLQALVPEDESGGWQWIHLPRELEFIGPMLGTPPQLERITIARDQCWETENEWYPRSNGWV